MRRILAALASDHDRIVSRIVDTVVDMKADRNPVSPSRSRTFGGHGAGHLRGVFRPAFFLAAMLATAPALPQSSTIINLGTVATPASTDWFILQQVGSARAVKQSRANLFSGFFGGTGTYASSCVVAAPTGSTGTLSCRALAAGDIPTLAYLTSLTMPADFTVTGTTALTVTRNSQAANLVQASPNGSSGAPSFRALVNADLPPIATAKLLGSVSGSTAAPGAVTVSTGLNLSSGGVLTATGAGTVTSVALALPSWFTVTGSPVTTTGTLTGAAATGQTTGRVIGTCAGATTFAPCQLSLTTDVTGTLPAAQFPALTGAVTTSAGSLATTFQASPVFKSPTIGVAGTAGSSHITCAGTVPTVACTGIGGGGTSAISGTDCAMVITMTAASGATNTGTCTVTMNGTWTNAPICTALLVSGTGTWQNASTIFMTAESTTAPQFTWYNDALGVLTNLTNGSTYKLDVVCFGR